MYLYQLLLLIKQLLLLVAERDGESGPELCAASLFFKDCHTLYGRYWGCYQDFDFLHFEACYYQAIDFAISHKLGCVEAGAQGFHKVQRGYLPITTYSAHWIPHDGFRAAIARFLRAEADGVIDEQNQIALASPFKKKDSEALC